MKMEGDDYQHAQCNGRPRQTLHKLLVEFLMIWLYKCFEVQHVFSHMYNDANIFRIHIRLHQEWDGWRILLMQLHILLPQKCINIIVHVAHQNK